MNKITIFKKEDRIVGFEMLGHAGARNDRGVDLVCSALSVLSQNLIFSLIDIAKIKKEYMSIEADERKGYLKLILPEEGSIEEEVLMKSFKLGVETLSDTYPKHVRIRYREV
ncbi:MAG: ribosomal-processing cysteine protease Prp [Tissierellia bacterium]|nr:ribosomal-processing cysteine protease Prp [Tissierellia bacterium]